MKESTKGMITSGLQLAAGCMMAFNAVSQPAQTVLQIAAVAGTFAAGIISALGARQSEHPPLSPPRGRCFG